MNIASMSRGRRYALAALSTLGAGAALLAVGGANPFLDIDHNLNHNKVNVSPVTCATVLGVGSSQIQALDLGHQRQKDHTKASFCKDVN